MVKKILIGGVVAGILVFIWGAVSHTVLPLGHVGLKDLPAEDVVLTSLKKSITEPGLYTFPGMDRDKSGDVSSEEMAAAKVKYEAGPTGMLLYQPQGRAGMTMQLVIEFITNVLGGLIAALLVSLTAAGFGARVLCVMLMGLFGWLAIDVSYWNWYRFPLDFTGAAAAEQVIGWLIAGVAIAAIVKPSSDSGMAM